MPAESTHSTPIDFLRVSSSFSLLRFFDLRCELFDEKEEYCRAEVGSLLELLAFTEFNWHL